MSKTRVPTHQMRQTLGMSAQYSANVNISNVTITTLKPTVEFWNDGNYDSSTGKYTAPVSGYYWVEVMGMMSQLADATTSYNYIYVGEVLWTRSTVRCTTANYERPMTVGMLVYCAAGNYITHRIYHNGGVTEAMLGTDYHNFSVAFMGE